MNEFERINKYDVGYFTRPRNPEIKAFLAGKIRRDMACAVAYALGYNSFVDACHALGCSTDQKPFVSLDPNAVRNLKPKRDPGIVVDVGCGRGELCALMSGMGYEVIGIDPSPGAYDLFFETQSRWGGNNDRTQFLSMSAFEGLLYVKEAQTVIFCESVEHIPMTELTETMDEVETLLMFSSPGGRLIITNQVAKHPIVPDHTGYDHITRIDNAFYARITLSAPRFRRDGSHLVVDYGM